jgi:hypothetical protein
MTAPAAPPVDPRLQGIDKIRDTARWLILAFAAIGAALAGSAPLSNLGKLAISDWRLWLAAGAAGAGLIAIAAAIWVTANVLAPVTQQLPNLVADPALATLFANNFELLRGHGHNLAEFQTEYNATRNAYLAAAAAHRDHPADAAVAATEQQARAALQALAPIVDRIISEGLRLTVEQRFRDARPAMFGCAIAAGIAIVAFAWAANPATPTPTQAAAEPAHTPPELSAATEGPGVAISTTDATRLLRQNGTSASTARTWIASFKGQIQARTISKGATYRRYSATPTGSGNFLTPARFPNPQQAELALHLPYQNNASCLQRVRAKQRTLILEGAINAGQPGIKQILILRKDTFTFPRGKSYANSICKPA